MGLVFHLVEGREEKGKGREGKGRGGFFPAMGLRRVGRQDARRSFLPARNSEARLHLFFGETRKYDAYAPPPPSSSQRFSPAATRHDKRR